MKKRLLITSIVMMLVVAVALGTSTYAWFTSNASVKANSITMTAAINTNAALEIGYVNTEGAWLTEIDAVSPSGGFSPASPDVFVKRVLDDPATTDTNEAIPGTYFSAISWKNADVINGQFAADGVSGKEYIWNDGTGDGKGHTTIFLHNASTANVISNVTLSATITGDAAPFIRVAVFKKDSTVAAGNFELIGVISNLVNFTKATTWTGSDADYYTSTAHNAVAVHYDSQAAFDDVAMKYVKTESYAGVTVGDVTSGKQISTMTNPEYCTSTVALGDLAVNNNAAYGADEMELKIVVWMDGSALNDDTAGSALTGVGSKNASIALTFSASR